MYLAVLQFCRYCQISGGCFFLNFIQREEGCVQQDVHKERPHTGQPQLEAAETKSAFSTNCRARKTLFSPIYFNKHHHMMPLIIF